MRPLRLLLGLDVILKLNFRVMLLEEDRGVDLVGF